MQVSDATEKDSYSQNANALDGVREREKAKCGSIVGLEIRKLRGSPGA